LSWVDNLDKSAWTVPQIALLLCYLPFTEPVWHRATIWLGEYENDYWQRVKANSFPQDGDIGKAIDKLIEYGRPDAAIECLQGMLFRNLPLDKFCTVRTLLEAVHSAETIDPMTICELIKALQNADDTDPIDLCRVEWAYLPFLNDYNGAAPKSLEKRLATQPEHFCEIIRLAYRSTKENEAQKDLSEKEQTIATNACRLLEKWRIPPGTHSDGTFSEEQFTQWLKKAKEICIESGHIDIAQYHIGKVLVYSPSDPKGLWLNETVAEALNAKDAEKMREGFSSAIFFPKEGVCTVDPSGKEQRQFAQKYREKADAVENSGYQRLATALRELAAGYDFDAERNERSS
jgi:hypothetical protein